MNAKIFKNICLGCLFFLCACQKNNNGSNNGNTPANLPGTLYWFFAGSAGSYTLSTGDYLEEMMKMGTASSHFDAFDISWDNKKILLTMDVEGTFNFDERRFVVRTKNNNISYNDIKSGNNLLDFNFEWEDVSDTYAHLSPNEKYVAVDAQHFSDLPIVILDAENGNLVSGWEVSGVSFLHYGIPVWTADNTLYFRIGSVVYRCSPDDGYASAPKVLTLPAGSSFLTVNPQGTKFVFRNSKHLWMCDIDGSNLQQITTAATYDVIDYDGEQRPVFSPDGKYIAFTGATKKGTPWSDHDYPDGSWVVSTGGKYGYIIVIPADGKLYDLDNENSGAVWLRKPGSSANGIPCSGSLIWR